VAASVSAETARPFGEVIADLAAIRDILEGLGEHAMATAANDALVCLRQLVADVARLRAEQ